MRATHERWDGAGYPDGLRGDRIPLAARVVSAVDALDAMLHARPYRSALPLREATRRLIEESGEAFDPRIVRPCCARSRSRGTGRVTPPPPP